LLAALLFRLSEQLTVWLDMLTFEQYLKNTAEDEFTIPAEEVEALVNRFGSTVRGMGYWNADGTLTLSRRMISEALEDVVQQHPLETPTALDPAQTFTEMLDRSSARTIIERLNREKKLRLEQLAQRLQNTEDENEAEVLTQEIIRLVFPS
jgi:hypothetical protein